VKVYDHTSAFVSDQDLAPAVSIRDLNGSQELGGLDLQDSTEWTEVRFTELVLLPFADETEVPAARARARGHGAAAARAMGERCECALALADTMRG
jgi:hypothetical protein